MVIIIGLIVIFGGSIYGFTHAGGKLVSLIHLSEIVRSKHGGGAMIIMPSQVLKQIFK